MKAHTIRSLTVAIASALFVLGASAQEPADPSARTYDLAELQRAPEFPGGQEAMYAFLAKNFHWPDCVGEGTVYIAFVVEVDGAITEAQVVKGANSALDREALRVISKMPMWSSGEQDGKAVRVRMVLPIKYCLN
jgi:protein TonB